MIAARILDWLPTRRLANDTSESGWQPLFISTAARALKLGSVCPLLCLSSLILILLTGCERNSPSTGATSTSDAKGGKSKDAATVTSTNFSVPFRGVIKAREQRDLLVNNFEITYTFGAGKVRRETVRPVPLGKLASAVQSSIGIICDVSADQVVLYRSEPGKKGCVRMTLSSYRNLTDGTGIVPESGVRSLSPLTMRPDVYKHAGTFFLDVPQPIPKETTANVPDGRTVRGLPCDLLTIQMGDSMFEISHCQRIKIERHLLELVELKLPPEVTGFPLLMRRLQAVPVAPPNTNVSASQQLLQKGVRWAANMAEKALKREIELLQITEGIPPDSAFTLDPTFDAFPSLDELHLAFRPPSGHHDDWD